MVHQPKLWNDLGDQLPMAEKSDHGTLRNHDAHRLGDSTHVGGGNVTAAESERHIYLCGHRVEVAACGKDNSLGAHHKGTIELRQLLDRSAEIEIADVA